MHVKQILTEQMININFVIVHCYNYFKCLLLNIRDTYIVWFIGMCFFINLFIVNFFR